MLFEQIHPVKSARQGSRLEKESIKRTSTGCRWKRAYI